MTAIKTTLVRWDDMPREKVSPMLERRLVTGDRMMLAHVYLKKGCIVPKHDHESEQFSFVVQGCLRFQLGADGAEVVDVRGGEVLMIPSWLPHAAEALEDTVVSDSFSPIRTDWVEKRDAYLRR